MPYNNDIDVFIWIMGMFATLGLSLGIYNLITGKSRRLGYTDGYRAGFKDGKLQKLVEFRDGTRKYVNPSKIADGIKFIIVDDILKN